MTLSQAAEALGISVSTVARRAATLKLGTRLADNFVLLTPAEVERIRKFKGERGPKSADVVSKSDTRAAV